MLQHRITLLQLLQPRLRGIQRQTPLTVALKSSVETLPGNAIDLTAHDDDTSPT
jgi:hypothetical protein